MDIQGRCDVGQCGGVHLDKQSGAPERWIKRECEEQDLKSGLCTAETDMEILRATDSKQNMDINTKLKSMFLYEC